MNIFAAYADPIKSAVILDDQRLIKMTLESCQMLASAAASQSMWVEGFPKPSHLNHPATKWVRERRDNFEWLLTYTKALDAERKRRWGHDRSHVTLESCIKNKIHLVARALKRGSTPFVNCARNKELGIDYTDIEDTHLAYRLYLADRWLLQAKPAQCCVKGILGT